MKLFNHTLVIILLFSFFLCEFENNRVFSYLDNAELQYETEEQKETLLEAFNDILYLSPEELKKKRYKDYRGTAGAWDLPTLLYRYIVPDAQAKTLGAHFYSELKSDIVQQKVRSIIRKIKQIGNE